jgi:hypothetical protein
MRFRASFALALAGAALLTLSACVVHMPAAVSSTSLGPQEQVLDVRKGRSQSFYILFFGPFGNDSISAAVDNAIGDTDADTMMNVFVDRKKTYIPFPGLSLVTLTDTEVLGTLVRYKDMPSRAVRKALPRQDEAPHP